MGIILYYYFLENAEKQHKTGNYIIKLKYQIIFRQGKVSSGCKNSCGAIHPKHIYTFIYELITHDIWSTFYFEKC